jgi:hypothetical protein
MQVSVRGEVVQDQIQLLAGPAGAQGLEERQKLGYPFAVTDTVEQFAGGQVEGGQRPMCAT